MKLSTTVMMATVFGGYYIRPEIVLNYPGDPASKGSFIGKCTESGEVYVVGKCYDRGMIKNCPDALNTSEMENFDEMFEEFQMIGYKIPSDVYLEKSNWNTPPSDPQANFDNAEMQDCPTIGRSQRRFKK